MILEQSSLEEFKEIIFEEYGIELTDEQAQQDALAFLEVIRLLSTNISLRQKKPVDTPREEDANVS